MPADAIERLLTQIGRVLAEDHEYPLDGTLLYAEVDSNYVAPSIFKDLGNQVLYRSPDLDLISDPLLDLWEAEAPDKRWTAIEYVVRDGKFDAAFTYADTLNPEEDPLERRNQVVARHFGEKPIVYPPIPEDDDERFQL